MVVICYAWVRSPFAPSVVDGGGLDPFPLVRLQRLVLPLHD